MVSFHHTAVTSYPPATPEPAGPRGPLFWAVVTGGCGCLVVVTVALLGGAFYYSRSRPSPPPSTLQSVPSLPESTPPTEMPAPDPGVPEPSGDPESSIEVTEPGSDLPRLPTPTQPSVPRKLVPRPPDPESAGRQPVRLGSHELPRKLREVPLEYPEAARRARVKGSVLLDCAVSEDGRVSDVRVVHGNSLLSEAAVDAVRQWVYEPTLRNGVPVPVRFNVRLVFSLRGDGGFEGRQRSKPRRRAPED